MTGRISMTSPNFPPEVTAPGSVLNHGSLTIGPSTRLRLMFDASIRNDGTLRLEDGSVVESGRCCVLPTSTLYNSGTLETGTGTATLNGPLQDTGTLVLYTGTLVLTVGPSSLAAGSRIDGTGRIVVRDQAELDLTSSLVVAPAVTLELQERGRIIGTAATVSGGGTFAWTAGEVEGALTVAADSRLLIDGTAQKTLAGQLTSAGTGTVSGTGRIQLVSGTFTNSGQLTQTAPATWTYSTCCTAPASWQNSGTYELVIPAGATALLEGLDVRNSGSVLLNSGQMFDPHSRLHADGRGDAAGRRVPRLATGTDRHSWRDFRRAGNRYGPRAQRRGTGPAGRCLRDLAGDACRPGILHADRRGPVGPPALRRSCRAVRPPHGKWCRAPGWNTGGSFGGWLLACPWVVLRLDGWFSVRDLWDGAAADSGLAGELHRDARHCPQTIAA